MMKAISKLLIAIISIIIIAIAGIGAYLYFAYLQAPVQKPTSGPEITYKTFTLATLDPRALVTYAPWGYIEENNYLQKYAPNINIVHFEGSGDVVKALETGSAQIGILPTMHAIQSIAAGKPIIIITVLSIPYTIIIAVNPNSTYKDPSQLKGKTFVATTVRGPQELFIRLFLKRMGWTFDDIKITYVGASVPATYAAVAAGKADAVATYYLSAYSVIKKGLIKPIYFFNETWPSYVLVGHKDYIKENPDVVRAVLKGFSEGNAAYNTNKDNSAVNYIIKTYKPLNLTIDEAKTIIKISQQYTNFEIPIKSLSEALKFLQEVGLVSKDITVEILYTKEFVPVVDK